MIERRISELEETLRNAVIVEDADREKGIVGLGRTVTVDFDGDEEVYKIVGPAEAMPTQGLISEESPIGKQLMGKRAGDEVTVQTPGGRADIKIKAID